MELKSVLKNKKAMGIGDLWPVVIAITVVGILLAIVMFIFSNWVTITNTNSGTINNETVASVGIAGLFVSPTNNCGIDEFAVFETTNASSGAVILTTNYTSLTNGRITSTAAGNDYDLEDWNVSYTYVYGGDDCEAMESIVDDYVSFIPWIGIILLIVAAAIVLGIVITSFASKRI